MKRLTPLLVTSAFLAFAAATRADVKLPAIFGDHMVLQRDTAVPVWGTAAPGEEVTVSIAGQTATATAGADGKWSVKLAKLSAAGLSAKGGELKGFVIAGADKQWKPATARIEGDKVFVSSADVKEPAAARYAWENWPTCNLYNGAGLPASPFRTDDWK
jgi:hypothetical protein